MVLDEGIGRESSCNRTRVDEKRCNRNDYYVERL